MNDRRDIAGILLELGAVSVSPREPFTWASGLLSPLYCDNRLLVSTVEERRQVVGAFVRLIQTRGWKPTLIAGTATAGIPHAAWIAEALSLPMLYIRSTPKKHGKKNMIEGKLHPNAHAVVIEDLISTGGSSIKAAQALIAEGAAVEGVAAIFQYGMKSAETAFSQAQLPYETLTDLSALLDVAVQQQRISDEERKLVEEWRQNPAAWSDARAT